MEAAHTFRNLLRNFNASLKKSSKKNDEKAKQGIIWVAKTYLPWQNIILTTMKEMYFVSRNNILFDMRSLIFVH